VFLLPVLLVLGVVGSWYLIPADIAWLLIEYGQVPARGVTADLRHPHDDT
jgi:hypothetical protein